MHMRDILSGLLQKLNSQPLIAFPERGQKLNAPEKHGVYVIRDPRQSVVHVGRTVRGKRGLFQRLNNHLQSQSSFVINFLDGDGSKLRGRYTFQYLVVDGERQDRRRALLEHIATAWHCPKHLGLGREMKVAVR